VTGLGIERGALKARYDVFSIKEDRWHSHTGGRTSQIVASVLAEPSRGTRRLLNAGSGCHPVELPNWDAVAVDLFPSPLTTHRASICATIESLPFSEGSFGAVVCVGEVLGYCDPARALKEFARVLESLGILVCDFGSSRSWKYRFTKSFGRAADLVIDPYNGSAEKLWIYDPGYVRSILNEVGFQISTELGTHCWSALGRRLGFSPSKCVTAENLLDWIPISPKWADIMTFVARRQPT
jgi:SAM-dependent methyltransferase